MPTVKAPASVKAGEPVDVDLDGFTKGEPIRVLLDGEEDNSTVIGRSDGSDRIAMTSPTEVGEHKLSAQRRTPRWTTVAEVPFTVQGDEPIPPPEPLAPVADFIVTPEGGPAGTTFLLTDTSTNDPTEWLWNIGAGSFILTTKDVSVTLPAADSWDALLTVKNAKGESSKHKVIVVTAAPAPPAKPTIAFTLTPAGGIVPLSVTARAVIGGPAPVSVLWDFDDGSPQEAGLVATHMFLEHGTYDVRCIATGPGGTSDLAKQITVSADIPGPLPTGKTVQVGPTENLQNALNDATIDTLVLKDGKFTQFVNLPARTAAKPLLIKGWHPGLAYSTNKWAAGGSTQPRASSHVTIEDFVWKDHPDLADGAMFIFGYGNTTKITLRRIKMLNLRSNTPNPQNGPHAIYVSSGAHKDILIEDYECVGYGASKGTAFHGYHSEGGADVGVTLRRFTFSGKLYCAILYWQPTSGLLVAEGEIRDCRQGFDFSNSVTGVIRDVKTISAGANKFGGVTRGANVVLG